MKGGGCGVGDVQTVIEAAVCGFGRFGDLGFRVWDDWGFVLLTLFGLGASGSSSTWP